MKPKIQSDSWGADLANALMLRPVYRRPVEQRQPVPEPEPEKPPVIIQSVHQCRAYRWEYGDEGKRVANGTIVACPDCGQWWGMEGGSMRTIDFMEKNFIRIALKIESLFDKKNR